MATINISSVTSYYNSATKSTSGQKGVSGYSSAQAAKNAAKTAATNAANSVGAGTPNSGGSSSTTDLKFGSSYGSVSGGAGTPGAAMDPDEGTYEGWCSYSSSRTSTMYQLKLKFTIPTGLTAANIQTATISFTATASHTTDTEYRICAPKTTTEQTNYQKYGDTTIIDTSKYVSFTAPGNTNAKTYSLTITDIFKQCITNGQGWVTILLPRNTPESSRIMTLSGTPQITYTENYSACKAPTSISFTSIVKPGGTLTISWSGAESGTNNTISGYDIYYKIGSAPTMSSYTDMASVSSTSTSSSKSFTVPSSASNNRGNAFYAMVRTKGTAGASYYSSWKEGNGGKVNSLPGAPTIVVDKSRIFSTGTTRVTFTTVTAGADDDTGQNLEVWYNTDGTSWTGNNCKKATNGTYADLSAATTFYFKTWDGLEYSSGQATVTIAKNTKPVISNFSMEAITTYSPNSGSNAHAYVKNIKLTVPTITKYSSGSIVSYSWRFVTATCNNTPSSVQSPFGSSSTGYTNLDVTANGIGFNTSYKVRLVVTDDIGESSDAKDSSNIFCIPAVPNIAIINQKSVSNVGTANSSHFGRYIRIYYKINNTNVNNTGLTRKLQYKLNSASTWTDLSITGTEYSDVDLNSLSRSSTYNFRVVYTCNSISANSGNTETRTRAMDMTPTNLTVIKQSTSNYINPYTDTSFNISFEGQPNAFTNTNDTVEMSPNTTYSASTKTIYYATFKYGNNSAVNITNNAGSNRNGTVTIPMRLDNWSTADWISCINGSGSTSAPNYNTSTTDGHYDITLTVTAKNSFGETFPQTKTVSLNFAEEIYTVGTASLEMKMSNNSWKAIPSSYNGKTGLSRYQAFETQTLRINYSGLKTYANQTATISLIETDKNNNSTTVGTKQITASDWTAPSGTGVNNHAYTLTNNCQIEYKIPKTTATSYNTLTKSYSLSIQLQNGKNGTCASGNNLNSIFIVRTNALTITPQATISSNFSLTSATLNNNQFSINWSCSDFGSINPSGTSTKYSSGYSSVSVQLKYSAMASSGYQNLGSAQTLTNCSAGSGSLSATANISLDTIYIGAVLTVTQNFINIDGVAPAGTTVFTYTCLNQKIIYKDVPNLLYGINFFALNANQPIEGKTDQVLELHSTKDGTNQARNKIYFNNADTYFAITGDGLVIDCGSW